MRPGQLSQTLVVRHLCSEQPNRRYVFHYAIFVLETVLPLLGHMFHLIPVRGERRRRRIDVDACFRASRRVVDYGRRLTHRRRTL